MAFRYLAVVATNDFSLVTLNVTSPANPTFCDYIGGIAIATGVHVVYPYAYAVGDDALTVIDLTDPTALAPFGYISGGGAPNHLDGAFCVQVVGNYAYVTAQWEDSLTIIDVTNPAAPAFAGHIAGAGGPNFLSAPAGIHVVWPYAYVAASGDNSLSIFDVTNPAAPIFVGHIAGAGAPNYLDTPIGVRVVGNLAYVTTYGDNSLTIIDVTIKAAPAFVGVIAGAGAPNYLSQAFGVQVVGNYAYVAANGDDSLTIIDISVPATPTFVGNIAGAGSPNYLNSPTFLEVVGAYAYVAANGDNSLTIINVTNPAAPIFVGHIAGAGYPNWLDDISQPSYYEAPVPPAPTLIHDVNELQNMNLNVYGRYALANDIDASATATWNWNAGRGVFEGFVPIGPSFAGELDGQGHKITGLHMNWFSPGGTQLAVFGGGGWFTGSIHDITFENIDITNEGNGGLETWGLADGAGYFENVNVISATILAHDTSIGPGAYAGAIGFCHGQNATIINCHFSGDVRALCDDVGIGGGAAAYGFTGDPTLIRDCSFTGTVTGDTGRFPTASGFMADVGNNHTAQRCYCNATVQALNATVNAYASGFTARIQHGTIDDCYCHSNVSATGTGAIAAGFIRQCVWADNTIRNSYALGTLAATNVAGFCYDNAAGGTIENCFWDTEVSGTLVSDGGTGKTTAQMQELATFQVGWDIEGNELDTALALSRYPFLSWQIPGSSPVWFIFLPPGPPPPVPSVITLPATEVR